MKKYVIVIIIGSVLVFADGFFPIGAYAVEDTAYLSWAHDSLQLNTVFSGWQNDEDSCERYLTKAYSYDLKVIFQEPLVGNDTTKEARLGWYNNMWHALWESEDTFFVWDTGIEVNDPDASDSTARVCSLGVHTAGSMQDGKWNWQLRIPVYDWCGAVEYTTIFRLKIDSTSCHDTIPVCSLKVYSPQGDSDILFIDSVLTVGDFQELVYEPCTLTFTMDTGTRPLVWYKIYWHGNVTLWADHVEVKDEDIDSLAERVYDDSLDNIFTHYNPQFYPALFRYYLRDEPCIGHYHANAYLMGYLRRPPYNNDISGLQALGGGGQDSQLFDMYADSVIPNELMIDKYPLGPNTPNSGQGFQTALDDLCGVLLYGRETALGDTLDFWFIVQSFGFYDSEDPDSGGTAVNNRLPTEQELRCMTWLSLAHGAKGIMYFLYETRLAGNLWLRGLWRHDSTPREPLYSEASNINRTLDSIGSILITLESDTVFKSTDGIPSGCFIDSISSDDTVQIGTFHNADNDTFFIVVNRLCQASDSDTVIIEIRRDNLFLVDLYTNQAIPPDSEPNGNSYFSIPLPPAQGRFFQLIPFAQDFKINKNQAYTNMPYVALNTKAWPSEDIDSMIIRQQYGDSLVESTDWIPYDTAYCWYLCQGQGTNTVYIMYKMRGSIMTPEYYADSIIFDKIAPTGSFVINDDSMFTNNSNVTLKNSFTDSLSDMSRMRYGNKFLKNLVKNSGFDSTGNWEYDTAIYHSDLDLFEIPIQAAGNYFYQSIPPESLSEFDNDTMLLWIDLVSDTFVGTGRIEFQYIYGDTAVRHEHPIGSSISIPQGTNAKVSHYNLYSYFMFQPDSDSVFTEVRVGVFVDTHSVVANKGRLFIDNLRLDVVSPPNDYTRFKNYDSLKEWTLTSGNGVRKVYGQFSDGAGNETGVLFNSIIVDTTKPAANISSPEDKQKISGNVGITGWAYDYADPEQHFKQYELKYQEYEGADTSWYWVRPDSLSTTPKNPNEPSQILGQWNTQEVTDNHGNGWYYLKLTVRDLAANNRDDTIRVNIDNPIGRDGEISGFSHDVYGLAAQDEIYIGEIGTGKIYRYNTNYQLIDTFNLIDSVGIGFPLAMALDDSGKLWAANITSHFINRFTPQGNLLLQFGSDFSLPSGIGFDNSGNIWVSDRMHHKIKKFDASGNQLFQFGTRGSEYGEIKRPTGIALYDDKIYIAESRNRRISVFDTLGDFIRVIGESAGLLMPFGLTVDSTGCLFVSDFIGDRIIEFGPSGNQLLEIDSILDAPSGLALSPDANVLYVSDTKHKRVLAFTVRSEPQGGGGPQSHSDVYINRLMFDVYPSIFSEQLNIRLQGLGQGAKNEVQLNIYDVTGRLVKQFSLPTADFPLPTSIVWHGEDNKGRQVSCGVYFIRLAVGSVGETLDYIETKKAILLK